MKYVESAFVGKVSATLDELTKLVFDHIRNLTLSFLIRKEAKPDSLKAVQGGSVRPKIRGFSRINRLNQTVLRLLVSARCRPEGSA